MEKIERNYYSEETAPNQFPKKVVVALAETRDLDLETIKNADLIEVKFFDPDLISRTEQSHKECLVHLLPFHRKGESFIHLNLANENLLARIEELGLKEKIEQTNPRWISLHLGWSSQEVEPGDVERYEQTADGSHVLDKSTLMETFVKNIEGIKKLFPGKEILLENLDWAPDRFTHGADRFLEDPKFVRTVLEKTDTGMLLDLEHAYVTARNIGLELSEYLKMLPLERVKEIHLSRPSSMRRSQRLKEMGITPSKEDLENDILVDVHRSLVSDEGTFTKRVRVILKEVWGRLPNLEVVTLELNLPSDQLNKNLGVVKAIIERIQFEK